MSTNSIQATGRADRLPPGTAAGPGRTAGASTAARATGAVEPVSTRGTNTTAKKVDATNDTASTVAGEDAALTAPKPLRFPWLSRLTQQLETAAKSKPAFPSAPVLGDNVDKKV